MIVMWFVAGLCLGWLHGWMRSRSAAAMDPQSPVPTILIIVGGSLLRLGMTAVLFYMALRQSVAALLLAFLGLWIMHWVMVFRLYGGKKPLDGS